MQQELIHQFLKNLKKANTWLSWWRHQMMTKVTFVNSFMETFSILSVQYMYKISFKMDKNLDIEIQQTWDATCFFTAGLLTPSPLHQLWNFQKSPAQIELSINLYLKLYSIDIYRKFYLYCLYNFRLFSGPLVV